MRLGLLALAGLTVRAEDPALLAEIEDFAGQARQRHAGRSSGEVPGVEEARALYKSLGLDPTKTRPSNEALLRRVLKGEALYRVSTLVDALNLCSLREQLPFGLYDLGQVEGPVELQLGRPRGRLRGHPQGLRERRGPPRAGGRPGALRQPQLGLAAHLDHPRHHQRAGDRLRPGAHHAGPAGPGARRHSRHAHAPLRRAGDGGRAIV